MVVVVEVVVVEVVVVVVVVEFMTLRIHIILGLELHRKQNQAIQRLRVRLSTLKRHRFYPNCHIFQLRQQEEQIRAGS